MTVSPVAGTTSGVGLAQQSPPSGGSSGCGSDAREGSSELVEGYHVAGDGQGLGCVPLVESAAENAQQRFGWSGQHIIGVGWLIAEADGGAQDEGKEAGRVGGLHPQGGLGAAQGFWFAQEAHHEVERSGERFERDFYLLRVEGGVRV